MAEKGVRSSKESAWDVDDLEIEIHKVEQPPCLAAVEVLGLTEVRQVLVICEDLYGEGGTMEIVPLGLQSADDGEELLVVDIVVSFGWDKRLGEVRTGVPVAVRVGLEEDGARGVLRGVSCNGKGGGKVREVENRF